MTRPPLPEKGRSRTVIENVRPEVDAGRFPIKRTLAEKIIVEADVFCDGYDRLRCLLLHRPAATTSWSEVAMAPIGKDRWRADFQAISLGRHHYTVVAWADRFLTWRHDLAGRRDCAR